MELRSDSQDLAPVQAVAGAAPFATLEHAQRAGGGELLRGETRFDLQGPLRTIQVRETAEVDASGRLVVADVELSYVARAPAALPGSLVEHATFDSAHQSVRVLWRTGRVDARHVESTFPWIYLPVILPSGATLSTPVAVSVARSAARAGAFALCVSSAAGSDASLSSDQFAIPGTNEDWIVLGDDLATFSLDKLGKSELLRIKVAVPGLQMSRSGMLGAPLG